MRPRSFCLLSVLILLGACGDSTPPAPTPATPKSDKVSPRIRVASYHRSPFSDNMDLGGRPPSRSLTAGDAAQDAALNALLAKATTALSKEDAISLINEARVYDSARLTDLAQTLLKHSDMEVRGYALTLLEGFDSPSVLPIVETALRDKEPDVRLEAVEVLRFVREDAAKPIYKKAIQDSDPNVRMLAFSNALELSDTFKNEIITENASSSIEDLARSSMAYIEADLNKNNLSTFISGLDHTSPHVKDQVFERMYLLFDKKFSTATEAQTWWQKNQHLYNQDLLLQSAIQQ